MRRRLVILIVGLLLIAIYILILARGHATISRVTDPTKTPAPPISVTLSVDVPWMTPTHYSHSGFDKVIMTPGGTLEYSTRPPVTWSPPPPPATDDP